MEVGSHLEVLVLIEEPEEDGSISEEYQPVGCGGCRRGG